MKLHCTKVLDGFFGKRYTVRKEEWREAGGILILLDLFVGYIIYYVCVYVYELALHCLFLCLREVNESFTFITRMR